MGVRLAAATVPAGHHNKRPAGGRVETDAHRREAGAHATLPCSRLPPPPPPLLLSCRGGVPLAHLRVRECQLWWHPILLKTTQAAVLRCPRQLQRLIAAATAHKRLWLLSATDCCCCCPGRRGGMPCRREAITGAMRACHHTERACRCPNATAAAPTRCPTARGHHRRTAAPVDALAPAAAEQCTSIERVAGTGRGGVAKQPALLQHGRPSEVCVRELCERRAVIAGDCGLSTLTLHLTPTHPRHKAATRHNTHPDARVICEQQRGGRRQRHSPRHAPRRSHGAHGQQSRLGATANAGLHSSLACGCCNQRPQGVRACRARRVGDGRAAAATAGVCGWRGRSGSHWLHVVHVHCGACSSRQQAPPLPLRVLHTPGGAHTAACHTRNAHNPLPRTHTHSPSPRLTTSACRRLCATRTCSGRS